MPSVQFYGVDNVMEAAENLKCPAWAIFVDRNMFSKYEGTDMQDSMDILEKNLSALSGGGTAAIYKLKFFENQGKQLKLNERSICDGGSFNFKLISEQEALQRQNGGGYYNSMSPRLEERLKKIEEHISGTGQEEEEEETITGVLLDILKNPEKLSMFVNVARSAIGLPVQNLTGIGKVTRTEDEKPDDREELVNRLGKAIDVLETKDPHLVQNMEKLASVATNDPKKFNDLLSLIELL